MRQSDERRRIIMKPDYDFYAILIFLLLIMLVVSKGCNGFIASNDRHKEEMYRIDNCKGVNNEKTNQKFN